MSKYILRRILIAFPLILGVTTVVFVMLRVALPGDPAKVMAGDRASPELIEQIRHNLGLDRPVIEQYLIFLRNFVQGDLGRSVKFREPVVGVIVKAFPFTATLTFLCVTIGTTLGLVIGVMTAVYQRTWIDNFGIVVGGVFLFHPDFLVGFDVNSDFFCGFAHVTGSRRLAPGSILCCRSPRWAWGRAP